MRREFTAVLLLVLCSGSVLAGSYLVNDTGEAVLGLRVEFSEPVTIRGFGDVLATVSPEGEASEFVFSGAELEPWGGHWLNWKPTSARLVGQEWLVDPSALVDEEDSEFAELEAAISAMLDQLPSGNLLFADDYETGDGRSVWGRDSQSNWAIVPADDGMALQLGDDGVNSIVYLPPDRFVFSCRFSSESHIGVMFVGSNDASPVIYQLTVDTETGDVYLTDRSGEEPEVVARGQALVNSTGWHDITVVLDQGTFAALINQELVLSAVDEDTGSAGAYWLRIISHGGSGMIDDVAAYVIPADDT